MVNNILLCNDSSSSSNAMIQWFLTGKHNEKEGEEPYNKMAQKRGLSLSNKITKVKHLYKKENLK